MAFRSYITDTKVFSWSARPVFSGFLFLSMTECGAFLSPLIFTRSFPKQLRPFSRGDFCSLTDSRFFSKTVPSCIGSGIDLPLVFSLRFSFYVHRPVQWVGCTIFDHMWRSLAVYFPSFFSRCLPSGPQVPDSPGFLRLLNLFPNFFWPSPPKQIFPHVIYRPFRFKSNQVVFSLPFLRGDCVFNFL